MIPPEPPPPSPTSRSQSPGTTLHVGWRILAAVGALAAAAGVLLTWFAGLVLFTGCFIKCDSQPDVVGGLALFALSGALLVAGVVSAKITITGRTRGSARVALVSAGVAAVAIVLTAAGS